MYRLIVILVLLVILVYMVRRAIEDWRTPKPAPSIPSKDLMIQDPVCKVYVTAESAIKETLADETYYFCSQDCAHRFRESRAS